VGNTIPTTNAPDYPFVHFSLKWGIGIAEFEGPNFSVYPNPASDVLAIDAPEGLSYSLLNVLGKQVACAELVGKTNISVSHLPPGVYMLSVTFASGQTAAQRLIISR
jgi:hypothetical protein